LSGPQPRTPERRAAPAVGRARRGDVGHSAGHRGVPYIPRVTRSPKRRVPDRGADRGPANAAEAERKARATSARWRRSRLPKA